MVDANVVAQVTGITTQYKDLRAGAVLYLPQHIAVFAQGASDASFSTDKFEPTSAAEVGALLGYGSPAHLVARELFPVNGDGVGTVKVTFYPIEDDPSAEPAVGDITPAGTATKAASYRVRVSGILGEKFTIPKGAVDVTQVCALMGQSVSAVLEMPVNVTYTYGTVVSAADDNNAGDGTVTALSVTGAALPGDYTLECITEVEDGGVFQLVDPNGTVIADDITMTPGTGGATVINEGGIQFTITDGDDDFEVGDSFTITVPATGVQLPSKWKGESANDLVIEVIGESVGVTFGITHPTGGLGNPSVQAALNSVGANIWHTMALNALNIEDTDALDAFQAFGEGRWDPTVRKPLVVFTGNTHATVPAATAVSSGRRDDRVNAQLVAPGSVNLPFVVAARQLARIARVANNNPPTDYCGQRATGLIAGADSEQWSLVQRDAAIKLGSSTVEVADGVVQLGNIVTFYRPVGEEPPAYRHVVSIVKLQNVLFNLDLIFSQPEWKSAPLVPNEQPVTNPNARKPKDAVTEVFAALDSLGLEAIISDPDFSKENTVASIDSQNPNRLNLDTTIKLSGNSHVISVGLNFGFYFGAEELAA